MREKLTITPAMALATQPREIIASGLATGARYEIRATLEDDAMVIWEASGVFVADCSGEIRCSSAPSEEGSYTGTDASGLFWSMLPKVNDPVAFQRDSKHRAHNLGLPLIDPLANYIIRFELRKFQKAELLANAHSVMVRLVEGVEAKELKDGRLRGKVFRWSQDPGKRGTIVSLTGSGGGIELQYAPILASLGYNVVSLAYFAYEDLPPSIYRIPIEYFEECFQWIGDNLGPQPIAVQGASRGGETSLVLASYLGDYLAGAIAIVPMHASVYGSSPDGALCGPSFTFKGREIPYVPPLEQNEHADRQVSPPDGTPQVLIPAMMALYNQEGVREKYALPVERFVGELLLVSSKDDQMWPSAWGADLVVNRLRSHPTKASFAHLRLHNSGHITPLPNTITSLSDALHHNLLDIYLACGGSPEGTARDSQIFWAACKDFYSRIFSPPDER